MIIKAQTLRARVRVVLMFVHLPLHWCYRAGGALMSQNLTTPTFVWQKNRAKLKTIPNGNSTKIKRILTEVCPDGWNEYLPVFT